MLVTVSLFLVLVNSIPFEGVYSILTSELLVISVAPKNTLTSVVALTYDPAKALPNPSVFITTESLLKSTNNGDVPLAPSDTITTV